MPGDSIDVETLRAWLAEGRKVTVVDVREGDDYAEWSIPGAKHEDVYDRISRGDATALDAYAAGGGPVVAVCYRGFTSRIPVVGLRARGVEAYSLAGGMQAWSLAWNVAEAPVPGSAATVVQVRRTGKGCLSYVVGSDGEAVVVDAALPPEVYEAIAKARGWRITRVLDTHVHADHLTRGPALAARVGGEYAMLGNPRVKFPVRALADGETLRVGSSTIRVLACPGHTDESVCYHLDGKAIFTGDTVFLNAIGRPDLETSKEGARVRAEALHGSLAKLRALDGATVVFPGHTSTPIAFDGRALAAPLSDVVARVPLLGASKDEFVATVLAKLPPTPPNHHRIVGMNEAGRLPPGDATELEAGANRCAVG